MSSDLEQQVQQMAEATHMNTKSQMAYEMFFSDGRIVGPFTSINALLLYARDNKLSGYRYREVTK